jgi:hypothetical protein
MAENRPYRPFAADFQVMQRTFFMQASVCGIRVLQNFVVEDNFLVPSDNLGQPSSSQYLNFGGAETGKKSETIRAADAAKLIP